jgi:thioredoxin-like negative regulator of GroEL
MYSHPWNNNSWNNNFYHHGFYGGFWPWWGLGWGYGDWGYGGYPWSADYAGYYDDNPAVYDEGSPVQQVPTYGDQPSAMTSENGEQGSLGDEFLNRALEAFHNGQYAESARWASHAAIESPKNLKVHELASLALFALKDYRGANMEAHAALALGPAADWNTLFSYYGDVNTYNQQLDALVAYIGQHPKAFDARFVLAYQDLMMGHNDAAKEQLAQVTKAVSQDKLASQLLQKLGGQAPSATAGKPPEPRY